MAWFADLAGKAENLLNNLDEQTGAALRNHNISNKKREKSELNVAQQTEGPWPNKKRVANRSPGNKRSPDVKPLPLSNKPSPLTNKSSPLTNKSSPLTNKSPPLSNKTSPTSLKFSRRSRSKSKDNHDDSPLKIKPASRKLSPNSPINEAKDNNSIGCSQRRLSLPENLETFNENDDYTYEMQNLEVENAMLRNELNVINRELTEMSTQLRQAGDNGIKSQIKLETAELLCHKLTLERDGIALQMQQLRQKLEDHVSTEVTKYLELNTSIQIELDVLKKKAVEYEEKCKELTNQSNEKDATLLKLENELRHAQSSISNLQSDLEKSNEECRRLEKDWEAYKLRVKNMLISKDDVIKSLRDGMETTADTKELMSQIESLKEERDELSQAVETVRNESENMKSYLKQVESRHVTAERVVCALRDALREEQRARNRADAQWGTVAMELKSVQAETSQAIDSLRTALRDKENEITRLKKESSSIARSTDTSALNVADYDVMQDNTIENSKLQALTHTLVLKQSKIDKLLAENNVLKIQLEKLESKFKAEMSSASHSLVQLQDNECRHRPRTFAPKDTLSALSVRMGVMVKRYPIMGLFLMAYMICLHFWVVYILCSSTPEDILKRPTKS